MTLRDEIAKYPRQSRLSVIAVLDEAVEDGRIDESFADELLLDWDVDHFPDQLPSVVCDWIKQQRASLCADLALTDHHDDDDD